MSLPSKELLSSVLGREILSVASEPDLYNNIYIYTKGVGGYMDMCINIYELMHMMKEWAWGKDYLITSSTDGVSLIRMYAEIEYIKSFHEDTEFDAITKACEWILEQQK